MVLPDAPNGEIVDLVACKNIPSIILTGNDNEEFRKKIENIEHYHIDIEQFVANVKLKTKKIIQKLYGKAVRITSVRPCP